MKDTLRERGTLFSPDGPEPSNVLERLYEGRASLKNDNVDMSRCQCVWFSQASREAFGSIERMGFENGHASKRRDGIGAAGV